MLCLSFSDFNSCSSEQLPIPANFNIIFTRIPSISCCSNEFDCYSTQEKRAIKVNPSWLLQGDNAPITVAIQKGYFAEKGLDVTLERGFGSSDTLGKVAAGQFEFGFGDMYSMIEFNAKNQYKSNQAHDSTAGTG